MFYVMYLFSNKTLAELASSFIAFAPEGSEFKRGEGEEFIIICDGFTLRLMKGGNNVGFASEDYAASFNFCCWFDIITSHAHWAEDMMMFINNIVKSLDGDMVVESNGDKPIIFRRNGDLFVDSNIGDGSFPFYLITEGWQEKVLRRD